MVLPVEPEIKLEKDNAGEVIAARLFLPAGRLFIVADGQHRREASRRVRDFLTEVIANRRTPRSVKFYPGQDAPLAVDEVEAWVAVQDTFRSWSMISYEAHIGLDVKQARQLFTNYNCHTKPVKADLNLEFDEANPINMFGKQWVVAHLPEQEGKPLFDLRQIAAVNGFLFLGKSTIRNAPYSIDLMEKTAKEFWSLLTQSPDWKRPESLLRELAVVKGLAKAWFLVFLAKRNKQDGKGPQLREYMRSKRFDATWVEGVPGLQAHTVPTPEGGVRFSPAHNDIVAKIVADALN
jgi:hypothetical protein